LISNTFRMPARRCAGAVAAAALTAAPVLLAAPAGATGHTGAGRASAAVLRTGLDVSLLNRTVDVPLDAVLNEVRAPASAGKTALTVSLDGVDQGKKVSVLRADVATARTSVDEEKAEGHTRLARAKVHVPGLPLLSLIELEEATSSAVCEAGEQPVAESRLLGQVTVLGKRVTLSAGGPTKVKVPGVGEVTLDLSQKGTTSRTAAATALRLQVSLNPLALNVAAVEGSLTLAEATCEAPEAPTTPAPVSREPEEPARAGLRAQSAAEPAEEGLAETGGSAMTLYLAGGAAVLLAAGGGAVALARARARR
jgi:hypothetical protein